MFDTLVFLFNNMYKCNKANGKSPHLRAQKSPSTISVFNYFIVFLKVKTDSRFHAFPVANKITKRNKIHTNGLDHPPSKIHTNTTIKYFQKTCPNINKTVNLKKGFKKRKIFFSPLGLGRIGRNRKFLKLIY